GTARPERFPARPRARGAARAPALALRGARPRALCAGTARAARGAAPHAASGAGDGRELPAIARGARATHFPAAGSGSPAVEAAARGDRRARVAGERGTPVIEIGTRKQ